jgi:hypothetical protein
MFDLISMAELSASMTVVIVGFTVLFGRTLKGRIVVATVLAAWFCGVLAVGATGLLQPDRIGVPGLGAAVALPVVLLTLFGLGTAKGRAAIRNAPLAGLVGVQAVRVLGVSFVILHALGRLPAPFAPVAGWGDIAIGAAAAPLALWLLRQPSPRASNPVVLIWNLLGLLDLVAAVALGAMSSPGPIRIFLDEPGSTIMTSLPWIIIPCFLVPSLTFIHFATFQKLRHLRAHS